MTPSRCLLVLVLLCAQVSTASADTKRARELFGQAEKLFAKANYARALELYREAYKAKPLAGFHFNMGLCQRELGNHRQAAQHFRSYLKTSKRARHKERATKYLEESEAAVALAEPTAKPGPVSTPASAPASAPMAVKPPVQEEKKPKRRRRLRPLYFWSAAIFTGALVAAGTVTGALALGKSSSYKDPATPAADLQGLKDSGEVLRTTSTVTFVLGAVGAAATATLFFFTDFAGKQATVAAVPTRDGAVLSLAGRF